jgi:hypothetical protein
VDSLGTVGIVSLAALEAIGERLVKIDRFARSPLSEARWPSAPPAQARAIRDSRASAGSLGSEEYAGHSGERFISPGIEPSAAGRF